LRNGGTSAGNGSHQTIAIVDPYDDPDLRDSSDPLFSTSDLAQFDSTLGLADPPSFTKYYVNEYGLTTTPPGSDNRPGTQNAHDAEFEECLDVEWAHAIAPAASIDLVEPNSKTDLLTILNAITTARNLPDVSVVSMSFGLSFRSGSPPESSYDSYFSHPGVAFVAAAGDQGQFSYPASSPNVLGVAGTSLGLIYPYGPFATWQQATSYASYGGESVWNGGQYGSTGAGQDPNYRDKAGPDVAYDADPSTGFLVYDSYDGTSATPWIEAGGTSAGRLNGPRSSPLPIRVALWKGCLHWTAPWCPSSTTCLALTSMRTFPVR
jgi:subtilase family serine protease